MEKHGADPAPRPLGPEPGLSESINDDPKQRPQETLADLGEWELIRRLGAFAPPGQFADDAALVAETWGGSALVVNTDVLVEGIHFSDATTAAADVGWRAAAANLSDLAAMGATEVVGITVGLVAPASTPWSWVEGVYGGLREALDTYGGVLLGGDCSAGAQRLLAITALGRLSGGAGPIRRADGRPGDQLLCTGTHGLSRLGLALLQGELAQAPSTAAAAAGARAGWATNGDQPSTPGDTGESPAPALESPLEPALIARAIQAHRRPLPRFDAVRALIACRPEAMPWRVGGCDSSDGLAAAVAAIATASGCAARLDRAQLPLDPAMAALPQAVNWCLNGGEDFELVLALEPTWAQMVLAALPGSSLIGELVTGEPGQLGWADGTAWDTDNAASAPGYSHFR